MKIEILGTRGEIEPSAPYHARHSGMLIDDMLMFDLGEKDFLDRKPSRIFITHLHPDHAFFVRDKACGISTQATIYAPEPYKDLLLHVFTRPITYGPYTIMPIPTEHSIKVKSQAYLIEKCSRRILYTGDLFWINKKYHHRLKNLDLVVTEASFMREGGVIRRDKAHASRPFGHAGVPDLMRMFKPFTNRMLFMHFGSWFYEMGARKARKKLEKLGLSYDLSVIACYDGLTLSLSE
jgi:ribonuclease BN (tRNA processing enzyme)